MKRLKGVFNKRDLKSLPLIEKILIESTNNEKMMSDNKCHRGETLVSMEIYFSIMKLWASFSSADINNDHSIDMDELPIILHLYEG